MDELEISGKRYLSSKRAAREHKYHADYIGQLIRSGKVVGTKVGRAWYVEAASLDEYLATETHTQGLVHTLPVQISAPSPKKEVSTSISIPVKKEPPHIRIEDVPSPIQATPLRYIADESPVFPVIQKTSQIYDAREFAHTTPKITPASFAQKTSQPQKGSALFFAALVVVLGGITFASVLFASAKLLSVVTVEQGKPASVGFSFE